MRCIGSPGGRLTSPTRPFNEIAGGLKPSGGDDKCRDVGKDMLTGRGEIPQKDASESPSPVQGEGAGG